VPAQNLLSLNDEEPPPKNSDKYSDNVIRKTKVSTGLVNTFFKDNVQRARDRNGRYVFVAERFGANYCRALELEQFVKDPTVTDARKKQKIQEIRRAEAHYLRFLRTKERVENFNTVKIIGKGAFGEVRLVQRRKDGQIYALKSLIKSEMVSPLFQEPADLCSSRRISWRMFDPSETSWPKQIRRGWSSCTRRSRTRRSCTC
jgi:protein-serine/threonine kinase